MNDPDLGPCRKHVKTSSARSRCQSGSNSFYFRWTFLIRRWALSCRRYLAAFETIHQTAATMPNRLGDQGVNVSCFHISKTNNSSLAFCYLRLFGNPLIRGLHGRYFGAIPSLIHKHFMPIGVPSICVSRNIPLIRILNQVRVISSPY